MKSHSSGRHGLTLVETVVVISLISILAGILIPAVQNSREQSRQVSCSNNIRQVALGMHLHHGSKRTFPPGTLGSLDANEETSSWGISTGHLLFVLPYVGQTVLADALRGQDPDLWTVQPGRLWADRPVAEMIRRSPVAMLRCPSFTDSIERVAVSSQPFSTDVQVFAVRGAVGGESISCYLGCSGWNGVYDQSSFGRRGVFFRQSRTRLSDIDDGTSQTFLLGEVTGGWTSRPYGLGPSTAHSIGTAPTGVAGGFGQIPWDPEVPVGDLLGADQFSSFHPDLVVMAFADGSVKAISTSLDRSLVVAQATVSGGEIQEQ